MELLKNDVIPNTKKYESDNISSFASKVVSTPRRLSMIGFIFDLPNVCTLCGLLSSFLGIYFAIQGDIYIAVISGIWAVFFDWLDGLVARNMKGRTGDHNLFGGQLDSLIDIVSFGVLPAIILLSYSNFNPWFLPGAFAIIASSAIRLSYFNLYGLTGGKTYTGLSVDYNGIIVSFAFLFERFVSNTQFSIGLSILLLIVVVLNLAPIQIPKLSKNWIYGIAAYAVGLTILFAGMH